MKHAFASVLLAAAGRRVAELHVGPNDGSHLVPGVYFVREEAQVTMLESQAIRKVLIVR